MWWIILAFLFALIIWLARSAAYIGRVSDGPAPTGPATALILIDLQTVFWGDATYEADTHARVEAAVAKAVQDARGLGWPVIALCQEWSTPGTRLLSRLTMRGKALAGSAGTELAPAFATLPDQVLIKRVQDGFETGDLDRLLARLGVGKLHIMGLDGQYCVQATAMAALNRGYEVTLIEDAVATAQSDAWPLVRARLQSRGAAFA